jgi:hypothetical protein
MKILRSLFLTLFIFGLLGWLYIVLNSAVHPETLSWGLTHFAPYPREDTAGIISFFISMLSFFAWNLIREDGR